MRDSTDKSSLSCAALNFHDVFHLEILNSLVDDFSIQSLYVIHGLPRDQYSEQGQEILNKLESHGEVHSSFEFVYRENIIRLSGYEADNEFDWNNLLSIEQMFYKICDRCAIFGITPEEKGIILKTLSDYFLHIIEQYKFNLVIAIDTPHSFFSYLFYALLVQKKVKIIRIEQHFLPDLSILVSQRGLPDTPSAFLQGLSLDEVKRKLSVPLRDKLGTPNAYFDTWASRELSQAPGSSIGKLAQIHLQYFRRILSNLLKGGFPLLFRRDGHGFASLHKPMSDLSYRLKINKILLKNLRLLKYYISLTQDVDYRCKYIFFPLHMQPEKTSMPLANRFSDQLFACTVLAASLPTGWQLFVKEHPNQFNPNLPANHSYRSKSFYKDLSQIPNVKLIAQDNPSNKLIASAQIVATLTGSAGWEGLCAGKPVIAFGESYYSGCRACARPTDVISCRNSIKRLSKLQAPEMALELYRHLVYLEKHEFLIHASFFEKQRRASSIPHHEHLEIATSALANKISGT